MNNFISDFKRYLFDYANFNYQKEAFYLQLELELYVRFYNKFSNIQGLHFQLPEQNVYSLCYHKTEGYVCSQWQFIDQVEKINKYLFESVVTWSSWSFSSMEISNSDAEKTIKLLENDYLHKIFRLDAYVKSCMDDKNRLPYRFKLHIIKSQRLASYLYFKHQNRKTIEDNFLEQDQVIQQIIDIINQPLITEESITDIVLTEKHYAIIFYTGDKNGHKISMAMLNLNFSMCLFFLEGLLSEAVERFDIQNN